MSTPRGFAVMPGNFDCPEATDSIDFPSRRPSIHRNYNPYRASAVEPGLGGAGSGARMERNTSPEPTTELNSLRRRINDLRRTAAHETVLGRTAAEVAAAASARARWARNSVSRSTRSRLHQHRLRRRIEDDSIGTVQEAVDRLNEANSDLSSILDEPLPQIISSDELMRLVPDTELMERRHKRRKLDSDALDVEPAPKYGYFGQVVPGRLQMSILGCDGGYLTERDENCFHRHYTPENVLRNDKSVYCTEKDQCNIILKHWKDTPFALTKIVIKTPDMGFTAPVQEGLIFVSMSADSLISRTSHYQISRTPTHPLPEATDPYHHNAEYRRSSDFISRYANLRPFGHPGVDDARPPSRRRNPALYSNAMPLPEPLDSTPGIYYSSWNSHEQPVALNISRPDTTEDRQRSTGYTPSEFNVTTTCDDPSDDEEEPTSPAILLDRQRRRHLGLEWPSSEDEDTDSSVRRYRRLRSSPREIKSVAQRLDLEESAGDQLQPHARFFIERRRNVVSVKFDPPVSGRYVLVKMWSPEHRDNIDIQSISVYGYGGTRFIPAIQLR